MKAILRIALLAGATIFLASCAGGTPPVTEISETVSSYCMQSSAQYEGHRDACTIAPSRSVCTPARVTQAVNSRAKAKKFCAGKPANTPGNLATIKGFLSEQRAAAR